MTYISLRTHFICPICSVPIPEHGPWFSFVQFTQNHHRISHIADYRLISHFTHLWTCWKMGKRATGNGQEPALGVNIDIHCE